MSATSNTIETNYKQANPTSNDEQDIEIAMDLSAEKQASNASSSINTDMDDEDEDCYPVTVGADEEDSIPSVYASSKKNVNTSTFSFANPIPPIKINGTLYCINIKWPNKQSDGNMSYMAKTISDEYSKISNGNVIFKPVGVNFSTNLECSAGNLHDVEQNAIKKVLNGKPKTSNDYFIIINHGAINRSHTSISQHISHNLNPLITTGAHELGHQLGFLHSNVAGKDGSSRDGTSFMSIFQSQTLSSVQLYNAGWLNGMVAYHPENMSTTYRLSNLNSYPVTDGSAIRAVILPQSGNQPGSRLFLSYTSTANSKNILALHKENHGKSAVVDPSEKNRNLGSTLMLRFSNSAHYGGYNIECIESNDDFVTVTVAPDNVTDVVTPKPKSKL